VDLEELQLVRRCLAGDQDACTELVDRYARMVGTVIWRAVGRHELVEDLAQETFMRVFRGLSNFDARSKLSTWVYTIAHRVAVDHLRHIGRMREEGQDEFAAELAQTASREPTPELALARNELDALVRNHVNELPDKYRLPVLYAAIDGLDYATIAEMLGHPVGTVKTLVFRGKQMLRERIEAACGMKTSR
jgi:RNA polymerase sigma-70 factor (ECF subfamily)